MVAAFQELADTTHEHGLHVATVDVEAHSGGTPTGTPRLRRLPSVFVVRAYASGAGAAVALLEGVAHDELDKDPRVRASELRAMATRVVGCGAEDNGTPC